MTRLLKAALTRTPASKLTKQPGPRYQICNPMQHPGWFANTKIINIFLLKMVVYQWPNSSSMCLYILLNWNGRSNIKTVFICVFRREKFYLPD